MEIKGKVHCFFEQSGTFKNEFIKLGIPAEDYDIQNNFGQTDHTDDLFAEIEKAYEGGASIFDSITCDDLIMAFFPCIQFCDAKTLFFKGEHISQKNWSLDKIMRRNIDFARERELFFEHLLMLVAVVDARGLRMIIENPWNDSGETYLQRNFLPPTIIDKNRTLRGDWFVKPTGYWYVGCRPTYGFTEQRDKRVKIVYKVHGKCQHTGKCDEQRSLISPDYARNFICDFILGKEQISSQLSIFD